MKLNYITVFFCASFILVLESCKKDDDRQQQGLSCKITELEVNGQLAHFNYDNEGRLSELQQAMNNALTYQSDRILISDGDYTNSYKLNADGLVTESTLHVEDGRSFTGEYTYENGYLKQITYDGEPVYHAVISFEYENGNISRIIFTDEFTEDPSDLTVAYQADLAYVPYSLSATDALVFWEQELLLYEQGYMGKVIKNRIASTDVDELVYTEDEQGNISNIQNTAAGKSNYLNYRYECDR